MNYTKWEAYCQGSEGYIVKPDNRGLSATKVREELKERLTPIATLHGSFEKQKANAHLIAAAPNMYRALKALVEYYQRTKTAIPCLADAIQAIAKAEGK